jgi:Methyltransferase FkbM domain
VKRWLRRAALSRGYTLGPKVADAEVLELIRRLRPRGCAAPLIRVGGDGDGGYLIPDDLAGIEYCFSPGVNRTADFENELANRNIRSFLADYSVEQPPLARPEFVFDRKFIGSRNDETFMTLDDWKQKYLPDYQGELLLQMDIEGGEYEVFLNATIELLASFRIIVVELHSLERLFDRFAFSIMKSCFDKLLSRFYVVHAHPNNCQGIVVHHGIGIPDVLEMTLYNRRRGQPGAYRSDYPHALDIDNCKARPPLTLPNCWR